MVTDHMTKKQTTTNKKSPSKLNYVTCNPIIKTVKILKSVQDQTHRDLHVMYVSSGTGIKETSIGSQNNRMAWVARNVKDHAVPTSLPKAGMLPTKSGCPGPLPTWS